MIRSLPSCYNNTYHSEEKICTHASNVRKKFLYNIHVVELRDFQDPWDDGNARGY